MKRLTVLCLSLLLALSLCACGGDTPAEESTDPATESAATETQPEAAPETSPETESRPASENRYTGTGIMMGQPPMEGEESWLELEPDGTAVLFIADSEYAGTYTLTDGALSVSFPDLGDGTGTLSGDVVTLDIINMTCTFEK